MSMTYYPEPVTCHGFVAAKLDIRGKSGGELTIVCGGNVVTVRASENGTLNIFDQKTGQALNLPAR